MKLRHISYSGGGPAIQAVLGGHIGVTASSPSAVSALIKSGALRPLVTTGAKRITSLPEVPTAVELGYKDAEFYIWIGLFAPANTPQSVVQTLRADIQKAVTMDNGFVQSMTKLGAVPDYRPAAAFDEFLSKDAERIKAITDDSDLDEVVATERHLLYVACTRARDHLLITSGDTCSEFVEDLLG